MKCFVSFYFASRLSSCHISHRFPVIYLPIIFSSPYMETRLALTMTAFSQPIRFVNQESFVDIARFYLGGGSVTRSRFKVYFGCSAGMCAKLWMDLQRVNFINRKTKPHHLLWGLSLLRCYELEEKNATFFHTNRKTFRQWSMFILQGLASLDKIYVSMFV